MIETLAYGYSSDITRRELSNEYQHYMVQLFFFQRYLCHCALDKSSPRIERVNLTFVSNAPSYTSKEELNTIQTPGSVSSFRIYPCTTNLIHVRVLVAPSYTRRKQNKIQFRLQVVIVIRIYPCNIKDRQHDRVQMFFKILCVLMFWTKVALALEGSS